MGQTYKKFVKHVWDDDKDERQRKQAGKRNHSRNLSAEDEDDEYFDLEDNKYKSELEYFLKRI